MKHYKMFLHVFNLFMNSTKSTGDQIDYGQRSDLLLEAIVMGTGMLYTSAFSES